MKKYIFLLSLLFPLFSHAFEKEHVGTYAVIHKDGHTTNFNFYVSNEDSKWNIDRKNKDGTWTNVSCENTCALKDASATDIAAFIPPDLLQKQDFTCIKNLAFAFCSYTLKEDKEQNGYALIALITDPPKPIFLKKISKEKI